MSIDINTIIQQAIKTAVAEEVKTIKSDLQLTLLHLQQQVDDLRRRVSATNDRINDLSARTDAVDQASASALLHEELDTQVQSLEKKVSTLMREKDIEDQQFTETVRQIAREVYDEMQEADNADDDVSSTLDQDNENARIRDLVRDVLQEEDFLAEQVKELLSDDFLADRVAEIFHQGPLVISVDRV